MQSKLHGWVSFQAPCLAPVRRVKVGRPIAASQCDTALRPHRADSNSANFVGRKDLVPQHNELRHGRLERDTTAVHHDTPKHMGVIGTIREHLRITVAVFSSLFPALNWWDGAGSRVP